MSTEIPERDWTNPFTEGNFLHDIYQKVVSQGRDLTCIVSDARGRRGTGKTVLSLTLAEAMDQTNTGLTYDKTTLSAEELRNAYTREPPRSALVLDEGEVSISNRRAMAETNEELRKVISAGRVEQKYLLINVPIKHFIDTDILKLCDIWFKVERRGRALVHHLKWEPYSETLHTEKKQRIEIDDIPTDTGLRDVYNQLDKEKRRYLAGDDGDTYVTQTEHEEALEKARKEARRDKRNELLTNIYSETDLSQYDIAEAVGVSQKTVSNVVRDSE